ncbi:MAG: sulfatase, partial [Myxococcales bacterium]|nr:sulfatase [Myxococcales bacterium]
AEAAGEAEAEPPFQKAIPDCLRSSPHDPFVNRYSTLPPQIRSHHLRLTTAGGGPGRVDMRDTLVVRAPQRLTYAVTPGASPRLEFGYQVFPCGGRGPVTLRVTTEQLGKRSERSTVLTPPERDDPRWPEVVMDLPLQGGAPATVTVSFESVEPGPLVAWAEPVLTGLPLAGDAVGAGTNVLIIVMDAVRSDVVGAGRREDITSVTPNLDRFFARGTTFTNAFSVANQTRPSTLGMLVAQAPSVGGFHSRSWTLAEVRKRAFYDRNPPILTRILAAHGYREAHIGQNHFLWDSGPIGFDHGWDRIVDFRTAPEDTPAMTDEMVRFIDRFRDSRWFVMLDYTSAHTPYDPPEPFASAVADQLGDKPKDGISRKYLGELAYIDHHVQTVFDHLEATGLLDKTLVIVTADHGEVMYSHHACNSEKLEMRCEYNHGLTLYDEETHVPFGWVMPGTVAAGNVVTSIVSQVDMPPTILDVLGLPPATGQTGESLRAALEGRPIAPHAAYFEGRYASALRLGDLKIIVHNSEDDVKTRARGPGMPLVELFDHAVDPDERENLAAKGDPRLDTMEAELKRYRDVLRARAEGTAPPAVAAAVDPRGPEQLPVKPGEAMEPTEPDMEVPPTAPAPAPVASGDRATNVLRLEPGAERELVATLTVPVGAHIACGALVDGGLAGVSCDAKSATSVVVRLVAREEAVEARFAVTPWSAPLEMAMTLDGAPFAPDRLRLGPYGLRLLKPGETLAQVEHLRLAAGAQAPHTVSGDAGVYLWRDLPGRAALADSPEGLGEGEGDDANMSEDVREVLRSLGYTK